MVDGLATSLIPLTPTCNFRLHPVVTQIRKAIGAPKLGQAKCWIFLLCLVCAGEIAVTAALQWAADLGSAG